MAAEADDDALTKARGFRAWRWPALAFGGTALVVAVVLSVAPAPIMAPWDVLILLDGGYRMVEGQVPSTDFANPVGPLPYALVAMGMQIHGMSLAAVAWGSAIMVVIGTLLTWHATKDRMDPGWRVVATIYAAVLLSAVRPLGYSPSVTTYAMLYNRYGWVLFTLVLLMVVVRPRRPSLAVVDHAVMGSIVGLLFYTKVTFTLAAGVVVLLGLVRTSDASRLRRLLASVAGFVFVVGVVTLLLRFDSVAYLGDIGDAARVQSKGRIRQLGLAVIWTAPVWGLTAAILTTMLLSARRRGETLAPVLTLGATCAAVVASSLLLTAGNASERSDLVALGVLPLVVVSSAAWRRRGSLRVLPVAVGGLLLATVGTIAVQDAAALATNVARRGYVDNPPAGQRLDSSALSDFVVPHDSDWDTAYRTAHQVPSMINGGIRMIRQHAGPGETVFVLGFGSPFNVAMGLPPTQGGLLWYDLGFDIDREHHPSADEALGSADWVMVPQMVSGHGCCQETVSALADIYGDYLRSHFRQADASDDWVVLRRTD